jgi:hypothetical protein
MMQSTTQGLQVKPTMRGIDDNDGNVDPANLAFSPPSSIDRRNGGMETPVDGFAAGGKASTLKSP